MGAQGWIATVLGIVMALSGALVAAPAFDAAVKAGWNEQWKRARGWVEFHLLRRRAVVVGAGAATAGVSAGAAYGFSSVAWPAGASVDERLELLRDYATETRKQLSSETRARTEAVRRLEADAKRQGLEQQERLESALTSLDEVARHQTKRQLAAVPFAAVGVLLTAAGSAVGLLPMPSYAIVLAFTVAVPLLLARLVWIAPGVSDASAR